MAEWKLLAEDAAKANWDKHLIKFDDCSPYQTYGWGQYHKAIGWHPYYFAAENELGEVEAMFLGLLKRYPFGTGLMWCTGGPLGDIETWNDSLPFAVMKAAKLKRLYLRFRCDRERNANTVLFLNHQNWNRSIYTMTSSVSMELDLSNDENLLMSKFSRNWRRNLKAAGENELTVKVCQNPNIEELCRVYAEMEALKNLPPQFSFEKLENLFKQVKSNMIFYRCEDAAGELLSFRGCLVIGNKACDYLAATTERGRELRASYPTFWELLRHCRREGVRQYDLGGIDPWANPGVYKFKKETGARTVEFVGEWDWANKSWLRIAGNFAIQQKQKIRKVESVSVLNYLPHKWFSSKSSSSLEADLKSKQLSEAR